MDCDRCGFTNAVGNKYCGQCGAKLAEEPPPTVVEQFKAPSAELRSYTPVHLAEKILKVRSAVEGERKPVTVLFCDITDSTPLAARLGAERMHGVLNAFFETALKEVHRYEGTVNQFLGDGFMALFGAPLAHEDHARRAVLAALAIRQAVAAEAFPAREAGLRLRMGLNSGAVLVGSIGDNLRMDYTAVGDTTNVAARVQGQAEPGSIVMSESVWRATQQHVDCRPLGPRMLKGKSEPVRLYELLQAHAVQGTHRRAGAETLVGRQAELTELSQALQRLQAGSGGVLSLFGEAGLGKSRLMEEARRLARQAGLRWLQGDCLSFGRTLSYWSFREVIRRGFGIQETDDEAASWRKVEAGMRELFAEHADELLPYIGTLLAIALPQAMAQRLAALDSLAVGHQIFRAMLLMCERSAQRRPFIMAFEDWHWADASSAALLEHLLPLSDKVPILFIVASRPEQQGSAQSLRHATSPQAEQSLLNARALALAPLPAAESVQLAEQLLGGGQLPAAVREMLLKRAAGNPFYLGELVRTLIATHAIERDAAGQWKTAERFAEVPLPDTIEELILARIDRLEDEVKRVLKAAAVVGRIFFYRVLKAITEAGSALDTDLTKLRRAELIEERQLAPELQYVFKHPLIQQVTYDSVLTDRRRQLHAQVGQCIEQLFAERLDPFYAMLAYHYAEAKDWDKAMAFLFKAAAHADRLAADEEALALYQAVIDTAERHSAQGLDAFRKAELESRLGEAFFRGGRHDEAVTVLQRALVRLGDRPPSSRFQVFVGVLKGACRNLLPAVGNFGAERPALQCHPKERLRFDIWDFLAQMHFFSDAIRFAYDGFALARASTRYPESTGYVLGRAHSGLVLDGLFLYKAAERTHGDAIRFAKIEQPHARAIALNWASMHYHQTGRWSKAIELARESVAVAQAAGLARRWAAAWACLSLFLYSRGDPEWLTMAEVATKAATETADRQAYAWSLIMVAYNQEERGDWHRALATMEEACPLLARIPDPRLVAHVSAMRCEMLTRLGRLEEAEQRNREALALTRKNWLTGDWSTRIWIANAELRLAQFEACGSARSRWMASMAVKAMLIQGRLVRDEGAAERYRFAGSFQWLRGNADAAVKSWNRGISEADALGARRAKARILFEQGRRTGRSSDVQVAKSLFETCGAAGFFGALRPLGT